MEASPLSLVTRHVRRICLLREQNNAAEAARLERDELASAVRDYRLAHGPESLPPAELNALFSAEEKRVADAVILSELLVPQLIKSFPAPVAAPAVARPAPVTAGALDSATPFPRPAAVASGVSPMIADLLDAMLASERAGRRPVPSAPA